MLCTVLAALGAVACDGSSPAPPALSTAPPQTASTTPVLDSYRAVWTQIDRDKLVHTMYVYPGRATIQLDASAPPNTRQDLIAFLASIQPQLKRVIELSAQAPEPFPPQPSESQVRTRDAHMDHPLAWMQNFARLLNADAMRCWESGDAAAATQRVIASIRLGEAMQSQTSEQIRNSGVGIMGQGLRLALALLDAGLASKLSPPALAELRAAANSFTIRQPYESSSLSALASEQLQALRQKLAN
jgi:hypothetical protein